MTQTVAKLEPHPLSSALKTDNEPSKLLVEDRNSRNGRSLMVLIGCDFTPVGNSFHGWMARRLRLVIRNWCMKHPFGVYLQGGHIAFKPA
jgi:hypothetical protein